MFVEESDALLAFVALPGVSTPENIGTPVSSCTRSAIFMTGKRSAAAARDAMAEGRGTGKQG
jgi:hypothetical protein